MKSQKSKSISAVVGNRKKSKKEITIKEQRFIEIYLKTGNGTQSAIEAGYKTNHPDVIAHQILKKKHIQEVICKTKEKIIKRTEINFQSVLEVLWELIEKTKKEGKDDVCVKAINEMNKMLGTHAPEKHHNINENREVKEIQEIRALYKKEI